MENFFSTIFFWAFIAVFGIVLISAFWGSFFTVQQQTRRIVSRFGKFVRVSSPGLNFKLPFIDTVSHDISLQVRQFDIRELSYTDKGTSITITGTILYEVDENAESVELAYYKLANPEGQIRSHVSSAIRGKVPNMTLEAVQTNQVEIASHVKGELTSTMRAYGYVIRDVLITAADPAQSVVDANNEKYASQQAKVTAENIAAANKTRVVESARADMEAMELHGQGIAKERAAITEGLQLSVKAFEDAVPGTTAADALRLVAFQQYVDALTKIGNSSSAKVIFIPSGGNAVGDLMTQISNGVLSGMEASKEQESK